MIQKFENFRQSDTFTTSNKVNMIKGDKLNWIVPDYFPSDTFYCINSTDLKGNEIRFHFTPNKKSLLVICGGSSGKSVYFHADSFLSAEHYIIGFDNANGNPLRDTIYTTIK
jgi:hypothetical protein